MKVIRNIEEFQGVHLQSRLLPEAAVLIDLVYGKNGFTGQKALATTGRGRETKFGVGCNMRKFIPRNCLAAMNENI
jgi:hypothetical protein